MRVLAGLGVFKQQDSNTYTTTPFTAAYTTSSALSSFIYHLSTSASTGVSLPDYFEKNRYKSPLDAFEGGPWQFTHVEGESNWQWREKHPKAQKAFNISMTAHRKTQVGEMWYQIFPAAEKLQFSTSESKDRVLLADIGGGVGQDMVTFSESFSHLPGRLILEDLEHVVATATDLPSRIEKVGHDFFTPQPDVVKGAKAYYLRLVLHDWPDKQAKLILSHIRNVMAPDSLLLLNENVLPESGISHFQAQFDMHMMTLFSAKERTEREWKDLLDSVGLKVRKVWAPVKEGHNRLSLIEAGIKA